MADSLRSLYYLMVFDRIAQIVLPAPPDSGIISRMWLYGAVVNSRRTTAATSPKDGPCSLREEGAEASSAVTSIVSSAYEKEKQVSRRGRVTVEPEDHDRREASRSEAAYQDKPAHDSSPVTQIRNVAPKPRTRGASRGHRMPREQEIYPQAG